MSPRFHRLDATGLLCPLPVLLSTREMAKLQPGDRLEVLGDDPAMRLDMLVWAEKHGHLVLEIEERGGTLRCLVEKGPGPDGPPDPVDGA